MSSTSSSSCSSSPPSSPSYFSSSPPSSEVSSSTNVHRSSMPIITLNRLRPFFYLPITEVAAKLGVCPTVIKKQCRRIGIPRWPYRKLKSMEKQLLELESMVPKNEEEAERIRMEKEAVIIKQKVIIDNPAVLVHGKVNQKKQQPDTVESDDSEENSVMDELVGRSHLHHHKQQQIQQQTHSPTDVIHFLSEDDDDHHHLVEGKKDLEFCQFLRRCRMEREKQCVFKHLSLSLPVKRQRTESVVLL